MTPLLRGALEAALADAGVEADVAADGVVYDRALGITFPRAGNASDLAIEVQAYVHADLILAAIAGSSAGTPGAQYVERLADRGGLDLADTRYEDIAELVSGRVDHFILRAALANASRIIAADAGRVDRSARAA